MGGGGSDNTAGPNTGATVGGGNNNTASGQNATVGGGVSNTASGAFATVPGGSLSNAQGDYSFAAGRRAQATNQGAFVWGDSTNADISSTAGDQVIFPASNGFRILNGPDNNGSIATLQVTNSSRQTLLLDGNEIDSDDSLHLKFNSATDITLANGGGSVAIGTASFADKLRVAGDVRVGTGATGCVKDNDGTVLTGVCVSDERLKTRVTPFPPVLEKIAQLRLVHFDWRGDEFPEFHFGRARSFGLISQDVERLLPRLVTVGEDGFKAVRYNLLPFLMLQAIRELKAENDALKEEVATRVGALETELAALKEASPRACRIAFGEKAPRVDLPAGWAPASLFLTQRLSRHSLS